MSALFCTREFSSATPEDRGASRPRRGMYESRRLPRGQMCESRRLLVARTRPQSNLRAFFISLKKFLKILLDT